MSLWMLVVIGAAVLTFWTLWVEKSARAAGGTHARLMKVRCFLVAAVALKFATMIVNYVLASSALTKILGVELLERDPFLNYFFQGTRLGAAHVIALAVVGFSFAAASNAVDAGFRLLEHLQNEGGPPPGRRLAVDAIQAVGWTALAGLFVLYLDTNLMLFKTALLLYSNELDLTRPGLMPDLTHLYTQFGSTAGVWMLRLLSVGYPALIFGSTLAHAWVARAHEKTLEQVLAEEDEDEEALDDGAPQQGLLFPGIPDGRNNGGRGLPWQRAVPFNNGGG